MIAIDVGAIWKFPVWSVVDRFMVTMPKGARVLCVQMQDDTPTMWAEVDPSAASEDRYFRIVGTGNPFPKDVALSYIGSVQQSFFVWHFYEELPL